MKFENRVPQASWFPCQRCTSDVSWSLNAWKTSCSSLVHEVLKHMADTLYFIERVLHWKKATLVRHLVMGSCSWKASVFFLQVMSAFCGGLPFLLVQGLGLKTNSNVSPSLAFQHMAFSSPIYFVQKIFVLHHEIFQPCTNSNATPTLGAWRNRIIQDCNLMTSPLLYYTNCHEFLVQVTWAWIGSSISSYRSLCKSCLYPCIFSTSLWAFLQWERLMTGRL